MFEKRSQPLLPFRKFLLRLLRQASHGIWLIGLWLFIGVCGYHYLADLGWIDSLLNASMIASGMGPVDPLHSISAKLFASFYAIFSGVIFIALMGILLTPLVHRMLHKFHFEKDK